VNEKLPPLTTWVGSCAPEALTSWAPGNPFIGHAVVEEFRRLKVTSKVPAAPDVPATLASRTRAAHAAPGGIVELVDDELVEVADPPVVVVPVVGVELGFDVHAASPTAPSAAARTAPRRAGGDFSHRCHRCLREGLRS
jgi:hypothetical protein